MKSQPNKRLSDVTKQQTVDRASKLASSFLSDDDPEPFSAVTIPPETSVEANLTLPKEAAAVNPVLEIESASNHDQSVAKSVPAPELTPPPKPASTRKDRVRRSTAVVDLSEVINQPVPEGLRSTKMIMLCDEHHDMLRELHFKYKKPMSVILYNLLEPAHEALQREHVKGN